MNNVEYKIERIGFDNAEHAKSVDAQLVERLNAWAKEGWRVSNIDMTPHPMFGPRSREVLLERDRPTTGS